MGSNSKMPQMYAIPPDQARFSISLVAPKDRTVHSNMPEESDGGEEGGDTDITAMAKVRKRFNLYENLYWQLQLRSKRKLFVVS